MNDEYLDIVDEQGAFTGKTALKSDAHRNGWYHHTTHVWIYNRDGEILLAQRSLQKQIHPGLWDVSSAGHVDAGESILGAAIREVEEELGIAFDEQDLIPIGIFKHQSEYQDGSIKDFEFHNAHIVSWNGALSELKLQQGEVDQVKWVNPEEFRHLLLNSKNNNHFIESNADYYLKILNAIDFQLKSTSE